MREEKGFFTRIFTPGTPQCAVACVFIGLLTALLLLWAGVWTTLLVAVVVAAGVFIGGVKDKKAFVRKLIGRVDRE